jgi:hypothetical protein
MLWRMIARPLTAGRFERFALDAVNVSVGSRRTSGRRFGRSVEFGRGRE